MRKGPTSHLPLHDDNDDNDTIEIPPTEILGRIFTIEIPPTEILSEILDRIFTSAPGGVAAPKILPRDFLYCSNCSRSVGIKEVRFV